MRFDLGRHVVSYSSEALANRVLHASLPALTGITGYTKVGVGLGGSLALAA